MRISAWCTAVLTYVVIGHPTPAVAQVDQQRAQEWFKEVQAVCEREGLRLWGMSLCGPMVVADSRTQTIATSQPAPEGPRPRLLPGMNSPIQWGGVTWGAYSWDTLANASPRHAREILLHELFHGIVQRKLGLMASELLNEHLDAMDGRYWLRLEYRALARALRESGAHSAPRPSATRSPSGRRGTGSISAAPKRSAPSKSTRASPRTRAPRRQ